MGDLRILLVDDSREFIEMTQEFVEAFEGFKVVGCAYSGEQALKLIEELKPALVVADISMPGMDGLELTRAIKARWPNQRIIILSLSDTPTHMQAAQELGVDAFVVKASMDKTLIPAMEKVKEKSG